MIISEPLDLIGKKFLFRPTEGRCQELQEGEVLGLSPSGLYVKIKALMCNGVGWISKYDFTHKLDIVEILE